MNRFSSKLFFFSARHQRILWGLFILLIGLSIWGTIRNRYSADMLLMLPAGSKAAKSLNTVINSGMANKITFYFSRKDGKALDNAADMKSMQDFAEKLKNIKGVTQVICSPFASSQEELYRDFLRYFPLLYSPEQLPHQEKLALCHQSRFKNLCLNPMTGTMQYRYDPFHWTTQYLLKFEEIMKISGTRFFAGNKSFIFSPERNVCMMFVYTDTAVTDYKKSSEFVKELKKLSGSLPESLECDFFSPHMHMLENAEIMKTDLHIFAISTLLIFGALFAFVYRFDWRGIIIPLLASTGGFFAVAGMGLVFDTTLLFTIAMGGVLIGIAGDYGIHLYAASLSDRRVQIGISLIPKLLIAFLTTSCAFFCFAFSGVPAFIQFGVYSFFTLLFAFLLLLIFLPGMLFFRKQKHETMDFYRMFRLQNISYKHVLAALFILVIFLAGSYKIKFDTDIRKFDIAYSTIVQKEKQLQSAFSSGEYPYILFYSAATLDEMLKISKEDKALLQSKITGIKVVSPSDFFTEESEQKKNLQAWKDYIASGKWKKYKRDFLAQAAKYGLKDEFFSTLFSEMEQSIAVPPEGHPKLLDFAYKSMVGSAKSRWTGVAMVDKKTVNDQDMQTQSAGLLFAEQVFIKQLFDDILGNLPVILPFVVLLIFLLVFLCIRSFTKTCLVFLPVAACLIGIFGIHGLLKEEINLAVLVAGIITIGISVDYGVLLVSSNMDRHVFNAITFSAITTAAGGLTVLFTNHPMLRAAGLSILAGILSSCFFSFYLLYPFLKTLKKKKQKRIIVLFFAGMISFGFCGCNSFPQAEVLPERSGVMESKCHFPGINTKEIQGSLLLDYKFGQVSFLIAGKMNSDGTGKFYGFSPAGIRLFSLSGKGYELENYSWMKATVPEERQQEISRFMYRAISGNLYIPEKIFSMETVRKKDCIAMTGFFSGNTELSCFFSGPEPIEIRRKYTSPGTGWLIKFCQNLPDTDSVYLFSDSSFFQAFIKMKFL